VRLAKYLARAGVASRRAAERLIEEGRVSIDGAVVRDPARDVAAPEEQGGSPAEPGAESGAPARQRITVDGAPLEGPEAHVVYALNKPPGVLSTARDPQGRPTVVDLVREQRRLYPVGRLDADTSGLILLTNDGELAHRLTHPRFEVPKTYRARLAGGPIGARALGELRSGVALDDGLTGPAEVRSLDGAEIEITIREGRNRQVRRMCEAVGHPVTGLARVRMGSLELGDLRPGEHRRLNEREVADLLGAGS
jgi:23S rRNA pseudouridine2605 synthase